MSIVVYSAQETGFEPGLAYRNPIYFQAPLGRPDKVIVIGNWPMVVAAYQALGVDVQVLKSGSPVRAPGNLPPPSLQPVPEQDIAAIRAEYKAAIGKSPFMGWDAETLKAKIAEVKAS